jgi:hypothetical protein
MAGDTYLCLHVVDLLLRQNPKANVRMLTEERQKYESNTPMSIWVQEHMHSNALADRRDVTKIVPRRGEDLKHATGTVLEALLLRVADARSRGDPFARHTFFASAAVHWVAYVNELNAAPAPGQLQSDDNMGSAAAAGARSSTNSRTAAADTLSRNQSLAISGKLSDDNHSEAAEEQMEDGSKPGDAPLEVIPLTDRTHAGRETSCRLMLVSDVKRCPHAGCGQYRCIIFGCSEGIRCVNCIDPRVPPCRHVFRQCMICHSAYQMNVYGPIDVTARIIGGVIPRVMRSRVPRMEVMRLSIQAFMQALPDDPEDRPLYHTTPTRCPNCRQSFIFIDRCSKIFRCGRKDGVMCSKRAVCSQFIAWVCLHCNSAGRFPPGAIAQTPHYDEDITDAVNHLRNARTQDNNE